MATRDLPRFFLVVEVAAAGRRMLPSLLRCAKKFRVVFGFVFRVCVCVGVLCVGVWVSVFLLWHLDLVV